MRELTQMQWLGLTTEQKSQYASDQAYGNAPPRWQCSIAGGANILVSAADEAEARQRYMALCGVKSQPASDYPVQVEAAK